MAMENEDKNNNKHQSIIVLVIGIITFIHYLVILTHVAIGVTVVRKKNTKCQKSNNILQTSQQAEGVSILRPLKGIDTEMKSCLSSAFEQVYPKFEILFCVEDESDAAVPVVRQLIEQYPNVDARLLIGSEHHGPNPKINNLSKAFREAKYDILWVLDSNVWVSEGTMSRSVEKFHSNPRIKLVHHLPMVISVVPGWQTNFGAKLDEMFMLTSHAKFYTAINTMAVAPCVMGKSNLYRKSDLIKAAGGLNKFAQYIAEDNMIADSLWNDGGRTSMTSDSVIQPQSTVDLKGYLDRRIRWLRVRRYMVLAATMVEPTTESIVCGVLGAIGTKCLFGFSFWIFWLIHMICWCLVDYWHFHNLLAFDNVEKHTNDTKLPFFVKKYYSPDNDNDNGHLRSFWKSWFWVWLSRECLALPIWIKAMSGHVIIWRSRPFRMKKDLTAEEMGRGFRIPSSESLLNQ